jgi:hypothetical protein
MSWINSKLKKQWMLDRMRFRGAQVRRVEKYRFWEDSSHPIWIESAQFFEQKLNYIHTNPVTAMLVEEPEDYIFSSARDYAGNKGAGGGQFILADINVENVQQCWPLYQVLDLVFRKLSL